MKLHKDNKSKNNNNNRNCTIQTSWINPLFFLPFLKLLDVREKVTVHQVLFAKENTDRKHTSRSTLFMAPFFFMDNCATDSTPYMSSYIQVNYRKKSHINYMRTYYTERVYQSFAMFMFWFDCFFFWQSNIKKFRSLRNKTEIRFCPINNLSFRAQRALEFSVELK